MKDKRKFYETKTFWCLIAALADVVLQSFGIDIPMLKEVAYAGTASSVADRLKK